MTQAVIPRPIAWVLTENKNGSHNLAPFSYFNALASAPPLIGVSLGLKPDGDEKDTLVNVRRLPRFVVHIASMACLPALNASSAPLPRGDSEVTRQNLPLEKFNDDFDLPRLKDAPLALACCLHKEIPLGAGGQTLLTGEILYLYASDDVTTRDDKGRTVIDATKTNPVARLSAGKYAGLSETVTLDRPTC